MRPEWENLTIAAILELSSLTEAELLVLLVNSGYVELPEVIPLSFS